MKAHHPDKILKMDRLWHSGARTNNHSQQILTQKSPESVGLKTGTLPKYVHHTCTSFEILETNTLQLKLAVQLHL